MGLLDQIGGVLGGQAGKAEQLQAIMTGLNSRAVSRESWKNSATAA